MKIEHTFIKEMTISEFAEKHDLTMSVDERAGSRCDTSFYAQFKGSEVSKGSCLYATCGNGSTPGEAIAQYASKISEHRLIFNAMRSNRKEILVPRLTINGVSMDNKPGFSINDHDSDGDVVEEGIYLHFEGCRIHVADTIEDFDDLMKHLIKVKTEIVENYVNNAACPD